MGSYFRLNETSHQTTGVDPGFQSEGPLLLPYVRDLPATHFSTVFSFPFLISSLKALNLSLDPHVSVSCKARTGERSALRSRANLHTLMGWSIKGFLPAIERRTRGISVSFDHCKRCNCSYFRQKEFTVREITQVTNNFMFLEKTKTFHFLWFWICPWQGKISFRGFFSLRHCGARHEGANSGFLLGTSEKGCSLEAVGTLKGSQLDPFLFTLGSPEHLQNLPASHKLNRVVSYPLQLQFCFPIAIPSLLRLSPDYMSAQPVLPKGSWWFFGVARRPPIFSGVRCLCCNYTWYPILSSSKTTFVWNYFVSNDYPPFIYNRVVSVPCHDMSVFSFWQKVHFQTWKAHKFCSNNVIFPPLKQNFVLLLQTKSFLAIEKQDSDTTHRMVGGGVLGSESPWGRRVFKIIFDCKDGSFG